MTVTGYYKSDPEPSTIMRTAGSAKALGRHRRAVIPPGIPLLRRREWRCQIGKSEPWMKHLASNVNDGLFLLCRGFAKTIAMIFQHVYYYLGRPNHVNRIGFRSENVKLVDLLESGPTLRGWYYSWRVFSTGERLVSQSSEVLCELHYLAW